MEKKVVIVRVALVQRALHTSQPEVTMEPVEEAPLNWRRLLGQALTL
jgi:hypothetical protein